MWNKVVSRGRWSAMALFMSLSGCTTMYDCKYEVGQKIRTSQAWHQFDGCNQECFTSDYRNGWKAGYYDVATGGTGIPPVIAPRKYWKPPVFCEHDPSRRNDWYCGFQDGAACAKCQPDYHYLQTFLPGCPVPSVAHSSTSYVPWHSSAGSISNQPEPTATAPAVTAPPESVIPDGEANGTPSVTPTPETQGQESPSKSDYEKDPDPAPAATSSDSQRTADDLLRKRIISRIHATSSHQGTLLEQLVLNASRSESHL